VSSLMMIPAQSCVCLLSYYLELIFMDQDGVTALMLASGSGHITTVNFLLTKRANIELPDKVR
jgi:ankyrin repeat protein